MFLFKSNTLGHPQTRCLCLTGRWAFCFLVVFICLGRVSLRHSLWSLTARSFLLALLMFGLLTFSFTTCRWRCSPTSAPLLWSSWGISASTRAAVQLLKKEEAMMVLWSYNYWHASLRCLYFIWMFPFYATSMLLLHYVSEGNIILFTPFI